ncbi:hypothetical protein D9M71_148470 [compost metagenome]
MSKELEKAEGAQDERAAFCAQYKHLDLSEKPDAWRRPQFLHSHVEALWSGWQARAALAQPSPAPELERQEPIWQFKSKCGDGWKETRHGNLLALLNEGYEIRQAYQVAQAGQVPDREALSQLIAAALFDFGGWLTTRDKQLVVSATDNAAPMADALADFCVMRGIDHKSELPILSWQEWLAASSLPVAKEGESNE